MSQRERGGVYRVHVNAAGPWHFYSQLFGWDAPAGAPVADRVSQPTEYSFIPPADNAAPAAGGIGGGAGFESHAIFYVGVETVSDVLATAEELGAIVVLPPQRNEGGNVIVAHFRDPAGNLVGIAGPA